MFGACGVPRLGRLGRSSGGLPAPVEQQVEVAVAEPAVAAQDEAAGVLGAGALGAEPNCNDIRARSVVRQSGGRGLLRSAGGAEPVGVGANSDDVGPEGEPVDHGGGEAGVGEGAAPLGERGVAGAGDGDRLLAGGDDLEQQLGAAGVEVDVAAD